MRSATRWIAGAAVVLGLAVAALAGRLATHASPRTARFDVPREEVAVPTDAASLARGRHLSESVAVCTVCHGDDLGGRLAFDDPLLGRGHTPNLTTGRGGIGQRYQVADWVRAIRQGVAPSGRGLLFMPVDHYRHLSDADLGAMIGYYRSMPPVDRASTGLALSWLARSMIDLGLSGEVVRAATFDHVAPRPDPPASEGAYLVQVGGCTFCHGARLDGGRGLEPGAPPGPDLTRDAGRDADGYAAFKATMRTGTTPSGHPIDPRFMPWQGYRSMTDVELAAIWVALPVKPPAGRAAMLRP